jgi:hypothetical protein
MTNRNRGEPVNLSLGWFIARRMTRASACNGVKQLAALGFVYVEIGKCRTNTFTLCDDWKSIDADEAKRRMAIARLPKPQKASGSRRSR